MVAFAIPNSLCYIHIMTTKKTTPDEVKEETKVEEQPKQEEQPTEEASTSLAKLKLPTGDDFKSTADFVRKAKSVKVLAERYDQFKDILGVFTKDFAQQIEAEVDSKLEKVLRGVDNEQAVELAREAIGEGIKLAEGQLPYNIYR